MTIFINLLKNYQISNNKVNDYLVYRERWIFLNINNRWQYFHFKARF